jgi:hypothetical protein
VINIEWRELRESLALTFGTFNTINPRVPSEDLEEHDESIPMVKSAEMVRRSDTASQHSGNSKVNSAKSAESGYSAPQPSQAPVPVLYDVEDLWEWIKERASIMEVDGGLNRNEAHHRAFMLWYRQFVDSRRMSG